MSVGGDARWQGSNALGVRVRLRRLEISARGWQGVETASREG